MLYLDPGTLTILAAPGRRNLEEFFLPQHKEQNKKKLKLKGSSSQLVQDVFSGQDGDNEF